MIKKTIKYKDFFDNEREETFYFGYMKSELVKMSHSNSGGLENHLTNIIETADRKRIMEEFENIILGSYGVKSEDGMSFIKNEEVCEKFHQSAAFDTLYMELLSDTDKAIEFVRGIMPKGVKISDADLTGVSVNVTGLTAK